MIRAARPNDGLAIAEIYNHYIEHSVITFEEEPIDGPEIARRLLALGESYPWLVIENSGELLGYAYATAWRPRTAYRYAVETSIYLRPGSGGRGLGERLYRALLERVKELGCHCALAGITLPNGASVALHEKCGFRQCGQLNEVGYKFDRWLDVGYWQLHF